MSGGEPLFAFSEADLEDALDDMSASGKDSGPTVPSSTDMQTDYFEKCLCCPLPRKSKQNEPDNIYI